MAYGEENTSDSGAVDGEVTYTYAPKTAQQNTYVADYPNEDRLHRDDQRRAAEAGVTGVDKIDYAEALRNYESRSDVEPFANRRAREYADAFEDQDFARAAVQVAAPLQSSTIATTTVAKGDDFTDETTYVSAGVDAQPHTADDVTTAGADNVDDVTTQNPGAGDETTP